ncbi:hypothetical protein [Pseudomonas sp. SMV7]|uniref:hypothetical protein n=1 Tax=Pseudomonas sp. SMV7 TaxID=3390194 RepID=UPI003F85E380
MALSVDQVYVVSGNLLSAMPKLVDPVVFEDFANSNLLCQLAADKNQGARFVDPPAWLDFYKNALGKVFWRIVSSGTVSFNIPPLVRSITIKEVLEKTFYKTLDHEVVLQFDNSIERFEEQPEESAAARLYRAKTQGTYKSDVSDSAVRPHPISAINLQVSVVKDGGRISVCSVYFTTSADLENDVFNQKFLVSQLRGDVSVSSFDAKLLESSYASIRQSVIEKLGPENIRENIIQVSTEVCSLEGPRHAGAKRFIQELEI